MTRNCMKCDASFERSVNGIETDDIFCKNCRTPKPKIYISGKISGIEDKAPALFMAAENHLKKMGFDPINPMTLPHKHDRSYLNFMKEDIKAMLDPDCNHFYVLDNWTDSPGAKTEFILAVNLGYKVILQGEDGDLWL